MFQVNNIFLIFKNFFWMKTQFERSKSTAVNLIYPRKT